MSPPRPAPLPSSSLFKVFTERNWECKKGTVSLIVLVARSESKLKEKISFEDQLQVPCAETSTSVQKFNVRCRGMQPAQYYSSPAPQYGYQQAPPPGYGQYIIPQHFPPQNQQVSSASSPVISINNNQQVGSGGPAGSSRSACPDGGDHQLVEKVKVTGWMYCILCFYFPLFWLCLLRKKHVCYKCGFCPDGGTFDEKPYANPHYQKY